MKMKNNMAADMPHLVEHDGGALPRDAVLPVVVGGVHGGAAEHAGDSAGSIGAVIGDATPGGRGTDVASVVVSQEGLYTHKFLQAHDTGDIRRHLALAAPPQRRGCRALTQRDIWCSHESTTSCAGCETGLCPRASKHTEWMFVQEGWYCRLGAGER